MWSFDMDRGYIEQRYYVTCVSCDKETQIIGNSVFERICSAENLGWRWCPPFPCQKWECPDCSNSIKTETQKGETK